MRDEISVEALHRRARQRHWSYGDDRGDSLEDSIGQRLHESQTLDSLDREQAGACRVAILLIEPRRKRNRISDHDRSTPVSLPPPRDETGDVPPYVTNHLAELHVAWRTPASFPRIQLEQE